MSEQNPEFDDVEMDPSLDEAVFTQRPDLTGVQDDGEDIPLPDGV